MKQITKISNLKNKLKYVGYIGYNIESLSNQLLDTFLLSRVGDIY